MGEAELVGRIRLLFAALDKKAPKLQPYIVPRQFARFNDLSCICPSAAGRAAVDAVLAKVGRPQPPIGGMWSVSLSSVCGRRGRVFRSLP